MNIKKCLATIISILVISCTAVQSLAFYPGSETLADQYTVCTGYVKKDTTLYDNTTKEKKALLTLKEGDFLLVLQAIDEKEGEWSMVLYKNALAYVATNALSAHHEEFDIGSARPIVIGNVNYYTIATKTVSVYQEDYVDGEMCPRKIGRIRKGFNVPFLHQSEDGQRDYVIIAASGMNYVKSGALKKVKTTAIEKALPVRQA